MRLSLNRLVTVAAPILVFAMALFASAHAATLTATPATFSAVIAQAKGGDTISLAPGAYTLTLSAKTFDPPVTISGPGVFSKIDLRGVKGMTFSGVELAGPTGAVASKLYPFFWDGVTSVRLQDAKAHTDPTNSIAGMRIQNSSDVTITRTEHWGSATAISWADMRGFEVSASDFHDLQSDAISGAGGVNVKIVGNTCTRFKPVPGDHPDCIQFWNTDKTPNSGVLIQGNRYVRGAGDSSTTAQGVFFEGQINATPRSSNVVIDGNVSLGSMYNGVSAMGTDGLVISNNVVAGFPDMESWIRWNGVTSATLTGNKAQNYISQYMPNGGNSGAPAGNSIIPVVKDGGAAILASLAPTPAPVPSPAPAPATDTRDAQIASLTAKVADLTAQIGALNTTVTGLNGQIATLTAQKASLAADLTSAQAKVADLTGKLSAASSANDNARAALATVRDQVTAALAR